MQVFAAVLVVFLSVALARGEGEAKGWKAKGRVPHRHLEQPDADQAVRAAGEAKVSSPSFYDICDQVQGALGYPCEHHVAVTADGFELDIVRIPPKAENVSSGTAYPVVLQHGLLDSAVTWVANYFPAQNLGCLLHDRGFDVWMPNSRGNHYSMGNIYYTQSDSGYWRRIDCDGMGKHDLPAVIDKVLNATNRTTLTWVGHSQGTWQAFTGFGNLNKNYAAKVDLFVALAPVAFVGHQTSFLLSLLADLDITFWFSLFGDKEFLANDWLLRQIAKFCKEIGPTCPSILELIVGDGNPANTNSSQLGVITRYDPAGTSVNNMVHWQQMVVDDLYQAHDYGWIENEKLYGSLSPPQYHLSTMDGPPTALFSGSNDALADPTDVATIVAKLPNTTLVQNTIINGFAHLDFVWGLDAAAQLYLPYVIPLVERYMRN